MDSPNGVFIVHECLLELALHLQDAGQVRVSRCKFWDDLGQEEDERKTNLNRMSSVDGSSNRANKPVIPGPSNPLLSLGVNHTNMNTIQSLCELPTHITQIAQWQWCASQEQVSFPGSHAPERGSGTRLQCVYHFGITRRILKAIHIPHWGQVLGLGSENIMCNIVTALRSIRLCQSHSRLAPVCTSLPV